MDEKKHLGTVPTPNERQPAGFGYIILPMNVNRDNYISNCLARKVVTLVTDKNEFMANVRVSRKLMQDIKFPLNTKTYGSCVFWQSVPRHTLPIITDIFDYLSEKSDTKEENEWVEKRMSNDGGKWFIINGRGEKGILGITVVGTDETTGKININVLNKAGKGTLNMFIQGSANIETSSQLNVKSNDEINVLITDETKGDKKTQISYKLGTGLTVKDEFGNNISLDGSGLTADVSAFQFAKGNTNTEPFLLGDKTEDVLKDLQSCLFDLATIYVTQLGADSPVATTLGMAGMATAAGQMPDKIAQITAIKAKIELIKSKIGKLN